MDEQHINNMHEDLDAKTRLLESMSRIGTLSPTKLVRVQTPSGIKLIPMNRKQRRANHVTKAMEV
jgi:hypothetical protein